MKRFDASKGNMITPKIRPIETARMLTLALICCGSATNFAASQVLLDEDFEAPLGNGLPAGWTVAQGAYNNTTANPSMSGVNTSANVLIANSRSSRAHTPAMDISAIPGGSTYTLTFDLYAPDTSDHGLIVGFGPLGGVNLWMISSTGADPQLSDTQLHSDLTAANQWQSFSFDITSYVTSYLTTFAENPANFTLSFQDWDQHGSGLAAVDNVTLTAVPEPLAFMGVFGGMSLAAGIWLRHRRPRPDSK